MFNQGAFLPLRIRRHLFGLAMLLLAGALALLLSSCATYVHTAASAEPGEVAVVGQLQVLKNDKAMEWGGIMGPKARLFIAPAGGREGVIHDVSRKDGMFFLGLAPGNYTVVGVAPAEPRSVFRVAADFTVPQDAKSIYIGTLKMETSGIIGYAKDVEDHYPQAADAYRVKFPNAAAPTKSLMKLESRLGTYTHGQGICAATWGLECKNKHYGVVPVSPPAHGNSFPTVDSLRPAFRWQPSSRSEVSYDLVIYQAVKFQVESGKSYYHAGSVIDYQQGLTQPEYRPETPLKPDNKYFWNVRLRRGDIVSNWSSFSYFHFYLVAYTWGIEPWFGFSTPHAANGGSTGK